MQQPLYYMKWLQLEELGQYFVVYSTSVVALGAGYWVEVSNCVCIVYNQAACSVVIYPII